ncbi:hypothetical protein PVAG01_01951 [Phlyctema vagabunda]|uniref:Uncharacterized protein n=1 Tax=Phlyctema vagabunda TaxID=108571 RepID=A0ABR4PYJ1_9HELO
MALFAGEPEVEALRLFPQCPSPQARTPTQAMIRQTPETGSRALSSASLSILEDFPMYTSRATALISFDWRLTFRRYAEIPDPLGTLFASVRNCVTTEVGQNKITMGDNNSYCADQRQTVEYLAEYPGAKELLIRLAS